MSRILVILQFLLIGAIAFAFELPAFDLLSAGIFIAGLGIFFLAFFAMKRSTFTIMPEPKAAGELVTTGVYSIVRHPMYLAVLLCALGACLAYGMPWKWGAFGALALVLWIKLRREERMLLEKYEPYAGYLARTKAVIPYLL